jgi:hypothetical protein
MPKEDPSMSESSPDAGRKDRRSALGADLVIPVLAVCFTIYYLTTSASLVWEARANGTVIGVILLVFCLIQFVRIGLRVKRSEGTLGLGDLGQWSESQGRRLSLLAILAVFVAAIPWLGTTLGLFLVMLATMWVLGVRKPRLLLGVSLGTAATMYILFIALLQTRLPAGPVEHLLNPLLRGGG